MREMWKVRGVRKGGRMESGGQRDMGEVQHLIVGSHPGERPDHGTHSPARCGAVPRRGGYGWVEVLEVHRGTLEPCHRCFEGMDLPPPPRGIPTPHSCKNCGGEALVRRVRPVPTQLRVECKDCHQATASVNDRPGAEAERITRWNEEVEPCGPRLSGGGAVKMCEECNVRPARLHFPSGVPGVSCSLRCDRIKFRRLNPGYGAQWLRDKRERDPGYRRRAAQRCREYRRRKKGEHDQEVSR